MKEYNKIGLFWGLLAVLLTEAFIIGLGGTAIQGLVMGIVIGTINGLANRYNDKYRGWGYYAKNNKVDT